MSLAKTTAELQPHFPARATLKFDDLAPILVQVEQEFLAEQILGPTLYTALETAYQADSMSAAQIALRNKVMPALVPLCFHRFAGLGNVEFDSGSWNVASSDTKAPAAQWRVRDAERAALRQGYRALDTLVSWLIENESTYSDLDDSPFFQQLKQGFIRTTQTFDRWVRIAGSGYLFHQLLPVLRTVETGPVATTFCSSSYVATILEAITDGTLTTNQKKLVELAQAAAAHLAMAEGIDQLALGLDDRGVWTFASTSTDAGGVTEAQANRLNQRRESMRETGNRYLERLRQELQAQAEADETHPYRSTDCYIDPDAEVADRYKTDGPVGGFM